MLWQFGDAIKELCIDTYAQISTQGNPVLSFVFAKNTGGAFSLFSGHPYVLSIFAIIVLIGVFIYVSKRITFDDKFKILSVTLFSAGIFGNLYERLTLGYVVDYIKLNFINFAIFNIFDVMICVSIALFCANLIVEDLIFKNGKKNN